MSAFREQFVRLRSLFVSVLLVSLVSGLGGATRAQGAPAGPVPGCLQPPAGLTAWWPLDQQFGSTTYEIMYGANGTSVGAPALVPARVSGGFQFDGVDDYVSTPLTDFPSSATTIDAWVWVDSFTGSLMDIVSYGDSWLGIYTDLSGVHYIAYEIPRFFGVFRVNWSTPVQLHTWYHVVVVFEEYEFLRLYVNGEEGASIYIGQVLLWPANFLIAAGAPGSGPEHFFDGIIDEVEIFDRVLDITEIQAIYAAGPAGKCKCLSPAAGLVSWWPGDGHARDIVGRYHGVLVNHVSYATHCLVGPCFVFDGVDDFVHVPDSPDLNPSFALTLNAWVQVDSFSDNFMDIAGKDPEVGTSRSYLLNVVKDGSHGHFRAHLTTAVLGLGFVTGNVEINTGTWYHVAMTYDGDNLRLYVNGVEEGNTTMWGMIVSNDGPFRIGGGAPSEQDQLFFDGSIDEVQLHNVALSAGEIQEIYYYSSRGQCKTCQFYLPLLRRN